MKGTRHLKMHAVENPCATTSCKRQRSISHHVSKNPIFVSQVTIAGTSRKRRDHFFAPTVFLSLVSDHLTHDPISGYRMTVYNPLSRKYNLLLTPSRAR